MSFSQLAGQDGVVTLLQRSILQDTLSHAYLFHGPPHVGKTLAADCFASALNCKTVLAWLSKNENKPLPIEKAMPHIDACGSCAACVKIQKKVFVDVQEISPLKKQIKVEQIDDLMGKVYLRPLEGPWKVFIISEAEKMHPDAASKLLKTLEEPPDHTLFILLSSQPFNMFSTILSRCQKIPFARPSDDVVEKVLRRKQNGDAGDAKILARLCCGQPGIALKMGEKLISARDSLLSIISRLCDEPSGIIPKLAEEFAAASDAFGEDDMENLFFACDMTLLLLRDALLLQSGEKTLAVNLDQIKTLESIASRFTTPALLSSCKAVQNLKSALWGNAQQPLCIHAAFLQIRRVAM